MSRKGAENINYTALSILKIGDEKGMMGGGEEEALKEPGFLTRKCWQIQQQACQLVRFHSRTADLHSCRITHVKIVQRSR